MFSDFGIGIFNKIQQGMNLLDERHAVLELTKGKLTTDPARHSGEGIFLLRACLTNSASYQEVCFFHTIMAIMRIGF